MSLEAPPTEEELSENVKQLTHADIAAQIDEYLAAGGKIDHDEKPTPAVDQK